MTEANWHSLGDKQRIDPGMQKNRLDREYNYAKRSHTHLWQAIITHKLSVQALENMETESLILDAESMMGLPLIGCFVCEQPYSRELLRRKCPGEPSD